MTDSAYQAKEWMERLSDLYGQTQKTARIVDILSSRINSTVGNYESFGRGKTDLIVKQQQHEDALLDYSEMVSQYEKEERQYLRETARTRRVIEKMGDPDLIALAIDRYINLMKWEDIVSAEHVSRAEAFRIHDRMLNKMAEVLKTENI